MVSFETVAPTISSRVNLTTLTGSFRISGLIQACQPGTVEFYEIESPLIDRRWQIHLIFNDPSYVRLAFLAKPYTGEVLDKNGERKGLFEVALFMELGDLSQSHTEAFRRYRPTPQYSVPFNGWSHDYWISRFGISKNLKNPGTDLALLTYTITERSDVSELARPSSSLNNIAACLFDDVETSNVVFVISDPRHPAQQEEYVYAHTKILATRADYFTTMFASPYKESLAVTAVPEADLGIREVTEIHTSESDPEEENLTDRTLIQEDGSKNVTSPLRRSRVVKVTDASYTTYRAMLYFLYTGSYSFAPSSPSSRPSDTSNGSDSYESFSDSNTMEHDIKSQTLEQQIPRSNSKSVYKLCDRLDIPDLKAAALEHIESSLTPQNITSEICSTFASRFPEVQKVQSQYLKTHWNDVKVSQEFAKFICMSFCDQPEGVAETWLDFFKQL